MSCSWGIIVPSFSTSAKHLGVAQGNYVVFRDDVLGLNWVQNGTGVVISCVEREVESKVCTTMR